MVEQFLSEHTLWLAGESGARPGMLVIPSSWLEWWVHECVWDFVTSPGWAVPLVTGVTAQTHWDLDFVGELLKGYPDQELASFIMLGVRFKGSLRTQVHGSPTSPQLVSASARKVLERLR